MRFQQHQLLSRNYSHAVIWCFFCASYLLLQFLVQWLAGRNAENMKLKSKKYDPQKPPVGIVASVWNMCMPLQDNSYAVRLHASPPGGASSRYAENCPVYGGAPSSRADLNLNELWLRKSICSISILLISWVYLVINLLCKTKMYLINALFILL